MDARFESIVVDPHRHLKQPGTDIESDTGLPKASPLRPLEYGSLGLRAGGAGE